MSQNDFSIANADGATVRSDVNSAFLAAVTKSAGTGAPSTTYQFMDWADTTANLLKQRNSGNSGWLTVGSQGTGGFIPYSEGSPLLPIKNQGTQTPVGTADYVSFSPGGTGVEKRAPLSTAVAQVTGIIVNRAYGEYTTNADLTTTIPYDDTIPQSTEGTEILTVSITPKATANRIRVTIRGTATVASGSSQAILALFKDSDANALSASSVDIQTTGQQYDIAITFEHSPATISAVTYKLRAGPNSTGAMRMNGTTAARRFGGVSTVTMVVEEIVG